MSLDGFVASPNQSVQEPLGIGGEQLHEWVLPLEAWRRPHGMGASACSTTSRTCTPSPWSRRSRRRTWFHLKFAKE